MASIIPTPITQTNTGRSFISSILNKLPYVELQAETDVNNPKYELFERISKNKQLKLMKQSVITGPFYQEDNSSAGAFSSDKAYHKYIYANVDADKIRRLAEYRRMAAFSEISDCLDEICDEFLTKDENGKYIKILFTGVGKIESDVRTELEKEFNKFIKIYDLDSRGWGYCRQLLIEGEIFFENIVYENKKDLGIIGSLQIPGELINPIYDNVQNQVIQNFIFQKPINLQDKEHKPLHNTPNPTNTLQQQLITLEGNQITYINSGIWNDDLTIRLPFIENARRAYKQLSMLEDAIVIYRMVRAPERLKFKIDVGNMPPAKAEAYLRQLMQSYWTKKTYDSNSTQGAGNIYDPQSMLDSFWFAKRSGETGSDVELLQGGANLGKLEDLMYFINKLYKALKVPLTRINPESGYKDGAEILREELKFAKFILRLQNQFAEGFKKTFISHLKLKGLWEKLKIHESQFIFEFNPPSNFFAIRKNQEFELKYKIFSDISQTDSISKTFAQRHYLNFSDSKISENMEWLRKDAALKWELDQIAAIGPNWRDHAEAMEQASQQAGGEPFSSAGSSGLGTETSSASNSQIPSFGEQSPETESGLSEQPPQEVNQPASNETQPSQPQ
jgi:hypothetical protein